MQGNVFVHFAHSGYFTPVQQFFGAFCVVIKLRIREVAQNIAK